MKNFERKLQKLEEKMGINETICVFILDSDYDSVGEGIFISQEEKKAYVSWRAGQIREDYRLGLTSLCVFDFDSEDVSAYIEEFRGRQE